MSVESRIIIHSLRRIYTKTLEKKHDEAQSMLACLIKYVRLSSLAHKDFVTNLEEAMRNMLYENYTVAHDYIRNAYYFHSTLVTT